MGEGNRYMEIEQRRGPGGEEGERVDLDDIEVGSCGVRNWLIFSVLDEKR
jgi:hypothetical protein